MIKSIASKITAGIGLFLVTIFGKLQWSCPSWLLCLRQQMVMRSKTFWSLLIGVVLILAGAGYAYHWYQNLPKPILITASLTTPNITPISEKEAPVIDPLVVDFGILADGFTYKSVAPLSKVGKEVAEGVEISPEIEGEWTWSSDSKLVFQPKVDWPAGQKYTLHFTKDFFAPGTKMESYDYSFSTLPFDASISKFILYQDPVKADVRQAVATIYFNFPVDPTSLEAKLSLMQQEMVDGKQNPNAKQIKYTLTYDEAKRKAYLHSENLAIPKETQYLVLTLNKGIKSNTHSAKTQTSVSKNLSIPDMASYFHVVDVSASIIRNDKDKPEQILNVETTLGVTQESMAKSVHVYLLPADLPATHLTRGVKNYAWQNPGQVTEEILALSTRIPLESIPPDRNFATLHSYKFKADSSRYVYVKIDKGTQGFGDFILTQDYLAVLSVPQIPREISFLHKGSLLALSSEKKLSVLVRGLPAVKFEIARVLPDNLNQLVTQTRGNFNNPYFINDSFNQQNISTIHSEIQRFYDVDPANQQYTALDLDQYLATEANKDGPQGLFLLKATGWDVEHKRSLDVSASRLILITDLGILVKDNSDGSHDVFVQSITEGTPVEGIDVSVLGKNGLPIITRTSDNQGRVSFPSLSDFVADREPIAYLARKGSDQSYIPYNNASRQLNLSRFDIGGLYTSQDLHNVSAYVFSDRGLYRPGDLAHLGMIVKQTFAQPQPAGLPLQVIIIDPRGNTVFDQKSTLDATGLLTYDFQTNATSPTGQYDVNLYSVKDGYTESLLGSTMFRVEEFLPDRMRITAQFSQPNTQGWVSPVGLEAKVGLWNLYGAPAEGRRVKGKLVLTPKPIKFDKYPDYVFADPLLDPNKPPKSFAESLPEATTNPQGEAQFDLNLEHFEKATYQLIFFAEGFEAEGGRSVTTQITTLVSPLSYFVGYKPDGDLHYVKQNSQHQANFIAINPELAKMPVSDLTMQLISLHPVSTLVKKSDDTYQYQTIIQSTVLSSKPFSISQQGTDFALPTDTIGEFALVVVDKNKTELSRLNYRVVGASQQPLAKNAELNVTLNKAEYQAGEDIELQITAPYVGGGLITIERDKVYSSAWFKTNTTSSIQTIKIPSDFQGNGYVNVAFVRAWDSPDILISPLSYAVIPFTVTHDAQTVHITLEAPKLVKPDTDLPIRYRSDKPGKIIVFAVDEGILQVSKYVTPDPLAFFFQKHALEVMTQQTVDQILPNYLKDRELSSVGGDASNDLLANHLNPFKRKTDLPVVYWSGILDVDTSPRELTYKVPDYFNGALRVMAVAVSENAVGSVETKSEVRGDFIISPNVPTFVAPGDEFMVSAAIANNVKDSGDNSNVSIQLITSPELEILGSPEMKKTIGEGHETSVSFKLRAKQQLGSAKVTFVAKLGDKTGSMNATLSVRPASAFSTNIVSGSSKDSSKQLPVDRQLYSEHRTVEADVSSSPLILVAGLQGYLDLYPYGCTEQLTSKALPILALASQTWFAQDVKAATDKINATVRLLGQRQMSNGAFTYWPDFAANQSNKFASVYAMHFLTEAREQNYSVPNDMFYAGIRYLREVAESNSFGLDDARIKAYAIYLLTRNEIVTSSYLTNLQLYLENQQPKVWKQDLTSAYMAATYKLLKNESEAERLISGYQYPSKSVTYSDFYDKPIADAQYLYLIAMHFPNRMATQGEALVMPLVSAMNSDEINTVVSGYTSLALGAYAKANRTQTSTQLTISEKRADGTQKLLATAQNGFAKASLGEDATQVMFGNLQKQVYFYQLTQAGFDKKVSTDEVKQGLEVYREYLSLDKNPINSTPLGTEIEVRIKIRSLNDTYLSNIAIVDLLPGGFEVVNDSVDRKGLDYADVREDRVVFFTQPGPNVQEIVYRIKATNPGEFTVPAILAQSMYNPKLIARGSAGKIRVTEAEESF
jgi:uncharacterized protein YfaS (alpha-2-macroglobulin family)